MGIFKAFSNLYKHLTKEKNPVEYEDTQELQDPEKNHIEDKTTLDTIIESQSVSDIRDWALRKIELLHEADRHRNARALAAEFDEWINIPEGVDEIDYLCLEDQEWTGDQEIDVR